MPITSQASAGPALAAENAAIEREIEMLARQRQTLAASNDRVAPVPERYRLAVQSARGRLDRAEAAFTIADTQVRLRIRQQGASEQLARLWYEEGTIEAERERQAAKQELLDAELALGRRIETKRHRKQVDRDAPGRRAAAAARYQAELDAIDRDVMLARTADTD